MLGRFASTKTTIASLVLLLLQGGAAYSASDDTPTFSPTPQRTALLITDPQNDFMSEEGAAWGLVKDNVERLETRQNIQKLMEVSKAAGIKVFVSPHTYFEHDAGWTMRGPIQDLMHSINMFRVGGPSSYGSLEGTGADFYEPLKPLIHDGETIVTSPHKVYGPESNDLVLQLRKRGIETVILGGFAANLCTDSHMRELIENGFSVVVVSDAVGAPGEEAYQAALVNYGMIANAVWTTEQAVAFID